LSLNPRTTPSLGQIRGARFAALGAFGAPVQRIGDFTIPPVRSTTPSITFTLLGILTAVQVTKICPMPDTTITERGTRAVIMLY